MDISHKKVLFLGDSITQGVGASSAETCYVSLFKKAYPNAEIHNFGVGGTRLARQVNPSAAAVWDDDFNARALRMPDNADLTVVFGGTNDYGHGDAPFGELGDKTPETFCGAVYALLETLVKKSPLGRILVLTPLHRCSENNLDCKGKTLLDYVQVIRKTAEQFSQPVLDLWSVSGINPSIGRTAELMMPDGLHPNDCGYQRLFEVIDTFIKYHL